MLLIISIPYTLSYIRSKAFHYSMLVCYSLIIFFCWSLNLKVYSQLELPLPTELQNLSVNARALEKDIEISVDEITSNNTQNILLNKTGIILHLTPSPKIKDSNTKIRIFSDDGKELEIFKLNDSTIFSLVDFEKNYFIVQEIKPPCEELIKAFNLQESNTICPDTESFVIYNKIMITEDTSFRIKLRTPSEFYSIQVLLPDSSQTVDEGFKTIEISKEEIKNQGTLQNINIADLLNLSEICIVSRVKRQGAQKPSKCAFEHTNINTIISFKESLQDKVISSRPLPLTFIFSYPPNTFNNLNHNYLFSYKESIKSENAAIEINSDSPKAFFLDSYDFILNLNLGQLPTTKTKVKKNTFSLTNPINIDKTLNKTTFMLQLTNLEPIINPFQNKSYESILTSIELTGIGEKIPYTFSISTHNNVLVKNLTELEDEKTKDFPKLKALEAGTLSISSYIPEDNYDVSLNNKYSLVEQFLSPSVDEKGKPIDLITNKSIEDLFFIKRFNDIPLNSQKSSLDLSMKVASLLLQDKVFKNQLMLSGFIIPPDQRPVIETNYRGTIELTRTIELEKDNLIKVIFKDLKTKDEPPVVNFFSFSFLPEGTYNANIKFDGDRVKLFESQGINLKSNEED